MRTAGGEAWKKGDHTRRDKEEKRGEAKGVDNTHISIRYPHPLLSPSIPFCPRTLSNHSEREQPTEQAVPRLLNVIKSSLPPSRPPPNRLDSFPPPFSSVRFGFLGLREDSIASRVQLVRLVSSVNRRFHARTSLYPRRTARLLTPQICSPIFE